MTLPKPRLASIRDMGKSNIKFLKFSFLLRSILRLCKGGLGQSNLQRGILITILGDLFKLTFLFTALGNKAYLLTS